MTGVMCALAGAGGVASGQQAFTTVGSTSFVVPTGVTSISVVCVQGGRGGNSYYGGAGGALRYLNSISVTPGETLTIAVGAGGTGTNTILSSGGNVGGASSVSRGGTTLISSATATGGGVGGGNGGAGGIGTIQSTPYGDVRCGGGGGGAGGYSGNGGAAGGTTPAAGSGGGGGGGGRTTYTSGPLGTPPNDFYAGRDGAGGGGVGLLGQGSNGTAGANTSTLFATAGGGGSGGTAGSGGTGGLYGGGGAAFATYKQSNGIEQFFSGNAGGQGAVRIIWGAGRAFPSTNTGNV